MDPLAILLDPLARLLNRNIAESTPARELAERLDGKVIAVRVRDTALAMYFRVGDGRVDLATAVPDEPDVVLTGTLLSLAQLAAGGEAPTAGDGRLELTGDLDAAQRFQRLLRYARPDFEEELSKLVGDAAAHQVGRAARGVGRWGSEARSTMEANIREYLQEESRDLPSRYEVERLASDIDVLRDDVDRLAARLDRLLARTG